MKKIKRYGCIIILLTCCFIFSKAQQTIVHIEELSKPKKLLPINHKSEIYKQLQIGLEKSSNLPDSLVILNEHPFLNGIVTAYQDHRPFTISPDMLWILIAQGFARHVSNNYNELRNQLVGFEGKKILIVDGRKYGIKLNDTTSKWELVFPEFNSKIKKFTGEKLNRVLTSNFSTTTPTSKIASQITIMEAFKNYFDYKVLFVGCGLPYVTLEGTLTDWKELKKKTEYLSRYNLTWWTDELLPILDNLILAKRGKTDTTFWKNAIKVKTVKAPYGPFDNVDGWITRFFPYDSKGKQRKEWPIYTSGSVASEIVKVPFILEDTETGIEFNMQFWAGFVGLSQNNDNYSLKPELGWAVNNLLKQKVVKDQQDSLRVASFLEKTYPDEKERKAFIEKTAATAQTKKDELAKTPNTNNQKASITSLLKGKVVGFNTNIFPIQLELRNIDEIPNEIYEKPYYTNLDISFRNEIKIPKQLTEMRIERLNLKGKISKAEQQKLVNSMPKTVIYINDILAN